MSDDKKQALLDAGLELLSSKTFSEISMDMVAELSGLSKPMIYYYFANKEGYYKAIAEHLFDLASCMMDGVFEAGLSLRENLKRYVAMRLRFVDEQPGLVRAFTSIIHDPNISLLVDNTQERFDSMRADIIDPLFDKAVELGEIAPGTDRMLVLIMINSTIVGHSIKMTANLPCTMPVDPAGMIDILFDGISRKTPEGGGE
jgi:AcrR family transcriptional regulator